MIFAELSTWLGSLYASSSALSLYITGAALVPILSLLLFRLWAFTIKPLLHPEEPKEFPYWIPYLGHAIEYVKNGQEVISKGREHFSNTREPFALTLGGEKLYFLTNPDDVTTLYKNTERLAFDKIVHELSITFGVSKGTMDKTYSQPNSDHEDVVSHLMQIKNPRLKSLAELNNDFWKKQLVPGDLYYQLQGQFLKYLESSLNPKISGGSLGSIGFRGERTVSLLKLTQEVLIDAALRAFFGDTILELGPSLIQDFLDFDEDNWKLWYKWPNAKEMFAAKAKVSKTVQRWLALPKEERPGASFIVDTMIETQRALGTSDVNLANILCMVVFVTNTNTYKVCFWALAYLVHDPRLLNTIRAETAVAVPSNGPLSLNHLMDSCPWLTALFNESLRYCSASSSIRQVTAPVTIGGKQLPVGARVMVPFRQLHFNASVYGADVDSFVPERFIRSKTLANSSSFRPFGGGISYCPGRFIARQEVGVFVALMLKRFDLVVVGDGKFPELDAGKPTTGLMSPKSGEDVVLQLTPRS